MRNLRGSLLAKGIAVVLLTLFSAGALLSFAGCLLVWDGQATAGSYYEDELCTGPMNRAMRAALVSVTQGDTYYSEMLDYRYGGFSYEVYDGDADTGTLLGGSKPESYALRQTLTESYHSTQDSGGELSETTPESTPEDAGTSGFYTVVGYLSDQLPRSSIFSLSRWVYRTVYPAASLLAPAAALLTLGALAAMVFLFCAAGHRRGTDGIVLNWQDRIPLDLYLLVMGFLFFCSAACAMEASNLVNSPYGSGVLVSICGFVLSVLVAGLLLLAVFMSIAARLKRGRWWRNTLCCKVLRWCVRLCRRTAQALANFIAILPLTWRSVLLVGGVLCLQMLLTLLMFESYNGGFFFLVTAAMDAAIVVGAAWMTRQLQQIRDMGRALADGDLDRKLDTHRMRWDIKAHAENLNAIGDGMTKAVERQIKSERLKTELITNVSHDIKTPLTSIVNYVDLLEKEDLPPTASEYLAVLDRQSKRLKKLTEDLVEASKASTGNVSVHLEPILVNEIVHQAVGDYDQKLTAGRLEVIINTYEGSLTALADGRLLWRVLDNLLGNVCKYALAGTRVYVDLTSRDGRVTLSMKNISRDPLNVSAEELMERFVRGDASRHTEGSGLGLNIARSLMELMGGSFSLAVDGDLFKAELSLRSAPADTAPPDAPLPALPAQELTEDDIQQKKHRLAELAAEISGKLSGSSKGR